MLIPTKFGDIEADQLVVTTGLIDDAKWFARYWEFRRPGEDELAARYEQRYIDKLVNPHPILPPDAPITVLQDGQHVEARVGDLERSESVDDNPDAFVWAVEYRRPGSPDIVHRSPHAQIKKLPSGNQVLQGLFG